VKAFFFVWHNRPDDPRQTLFLKGSHMQKKLIALAVAALASGAAFAQSNVTVYGQVDVGFSHRSSGRYAGGVFAGGDRALGVESELVPGSTYRGRLKSKNAIDSGLSDASKIGFKGVEDLGNGTKALFVLEAGFNVKAIA
jgi:predicted porin